MKRNLLTYALPVLCILSQLSCSADELRTDGPGDYGYFQGPIVIWNLSLFDQLELYVHPNRDTYEADSGERDNLLSDGPLADQDIAVIQSNEELFSKYVSKV